MSNTPPLILVDGSSYLYRAFHALPPLLTRSGQPTGAIKGVINMLQKLVKTYGPTHIAVVFDAPGGTFRDAIYPEYKANRPPMPDDLRLQIEPLHALVRALGLPLLCVPDVEADDVIGTLAQRAAAAGMDVLISTGDKDIAQLVNERITLINTMNDTILDRDAVIAKFGVPPERIVDYLALVGDSVDNIPGVYGVGPKTAAKWLQEYGTLDALMAQADSIKGKAGENLRNGLGVLPLAHELATIKCDCELPLTIDELKPGKPDHDVLVHWTRELEFRAWHNELLSEGADVEPEVPVAPVEVTYHTVSTEDDFNALLKKLSAATVFCVDTETTSLDYMQAEIVGLSFAIRAGEAWYVPVGHDYMGAPDQLARDDVLSALKPILENPAIGKIGQHLKYDMHVLENYGIVLNGIVFDTMLASYVRDATATRHNMDDMAAHYLGVKTTKFEEIAGKGVKQLTFNQVDVEKAAHYAAEDADITLRLHDILAPQLIAEPKLESVFRDIEMPLVPILQAMEHRGVLIDTKMLATQSRDLGERMLALEKQVYELAGQEFNLASPKQLGHILYEKLGIPVPKKTATGQYSTAEDVLEQLEHPLPKLLLEHRSLAKLKSTYTDKLPELLDRKTGRVHTSYHQAVTATGRLSSSDPNLQNIPIRTEAGRRIRQAFIAPPGYHLMAADYSQIELRIMAHLSGDEGLLNAFRQGEDVHRATAAEVFDVPLNEVTNDQRRNAKAINFGLIYGMSAFGLAKQLGIGRGEAQGYVDLYFTRYPGVKRYMENIRAQAAQNGYVETFFGRRLMVRDINAKNPSLRQAAERAAINAPMQGTAADIIKLAMIAVESALAREQVDARLIMQVHDELVLEVRDGQADHVKALLRAQMESAAQLSVPLLVEVGMGANWDEAH
ncbi:MAG: DNA polymerase I [Moraxellaceae bacterium]|jgi:DNA polymerase-1|nr:DNA polymerase I [Moraxellaceae bacterium]MBP7228904.1 DNA polymerase I [Moraxellaceae bacterium]MBP8851510.1 DNA polymerase I [Moraxellaceae bacterium]MBP9730352.1 DNA polymerase I [Moraxellaceae bacterium]HQV41577.1 DNA polymerase I [Moraxellaceae bacterium]